MKLVVQTRTTLHTKALPCDGPIGRAFDGLVRSQGGCGVVADAIPRICSSTAKCVTIANVSLSANIPSHKHQHDVIGESVGRSLAVGADLARIGSKPPRDLDGFSG